MNQTIVVAVAATLLPLLLAGVAYLLSSMGRAAMVERICAWPEAAYAHSSKKSGSIVSGMAVALLWGFHSIVASTSNIANVAVRNAVRVAATLYLLGIYLFAAYGVFRFLVFVARQQSRVWPWEVALAPAIVAFAIAAFPFPRTVAFIHLQSERLTNRLETQRDNVSPLHRVFARPMLWMWRHVHMLSDAIAHAGIRAATRAIVFVYAVYAMALVGYGVIVFAAAHGRQLAVIVLFAAPALLGVLIAVLKPAGIAKWISDRTGQLDSTYERTRTRQGFFFRFTVRPTLWLFHAVHGGTTGIVDDSVRAGIRLAASAYLFAVMLVVAYFAVIALLAIVLVVVALLIAFFIISLVMGGGRPQLPSTGILRGGARQSREREGIFQNHTEHRDADGAVIATSREREGFLSPYTEHRDAEGHVIGQSRDRKGFRGPYTEHRDADDNLLGESREHDGFLGPYTEHKDAEGKVIGKSREQDGAFGLYTKHEKKA